MHQNWHQIRWSVVVRSVDSVDGSHFVGNMAIAEIDSRDADGQGCH
jgi:hypothetical protein